MLKPYAQALAAAVLMLASGCAASYTPIVPSRITSYTANMQREAVDVGYTIGALRSRGGNKRYAKKEAKARYHVTALRVTNNTERELTFGRDLILASGDRPVQVVEPAVAAADMKQGVAIYLLYLLLNLNVGGTTTTSSTGRTTTEGGTFIPTGPFIAGGNMLGAGMANANFREDLAKNDLNGRTIKPGATLYGVVTLHDSEASALRYQLREMAPTAVAAPKAPAQAQPATQPVAQPMTNPVLDAAPISNPK